MSDDQTFSAGDAPLPLSRARGRRPEGAAAGVARRPHASANAAGVRSARRPRRAATGLTGARPTAGGDGASSSGGTGGGDDDGAGPGGTRADGDGIGPGRPRVYKLRLALIIAGLGGLAVVSTIFGMMMAVAGELPALENRQEYRNARNSILYDVNGRQLGLLTSRYNRILVRPGQISTAMQHAIIAVEDQRFYENNGVDFRGIGRALIADLARQKTVQGASTISQQFVKNALAAQSERTLFQKLREAALAYHLNRKWRKQKILTEYLNAVYFGNGAYGIESAARTYFGFNHPGCGTPKQPGMPAQPACAALLTNAEAALLAGLVASPSAYDPIIHPRDAVHRRNLVLQRMLEQGYITRFERDEALPQKPPDATTITLPREDSLAPYFTTWVKQQVIDLVGARRALNGGLRIRTTLDYELQQQAEQAVANHLSSPNGPAAALVAIDNRTGEVRAMVGGRDYQNAPFNLATHGQRQPGSAFKAFVLAEALREGISPYSTWESRRKIFTVPETRGVEKFVVRNYEGEYSGITTLASATAQSDNSVFAELGIKVGTAQIAGLAREMGIRTPVSNNYAITLGALKNGVTPLDMAHAFETLAAGGKRVTGTLGTDEDGPVGIREVRAPSGRREVWRNRPIRRRVVSPKLAETETEMLKSVICCGTGKAAATGGFAAGKTGTTENYGDAWFVGYNKRWTVAVWVGYPDRLKPMQTDYNGGPVVGGSYPAEIWHDFIVGANAIQDEREAETAAREGRDYVSPDEADRSSTVETETTETGGEDSEGPDSGDSDAGPSAPGSSGGAPGSADGGGGGEPPPGEPPAAGGGGAAGEGGGTGAPGGTAPHG